MCRSVESSLHPRETNPSHGEGDEGLSLWAKAGIFYLWLPFLVFAATWWRWQVALPLTLLGFWALATIALSSCRRIGGGLAAGEWKASVPLVLMAVALVLASGAGGWFLQTPDQTKHNLLCGDLAGLAWPVRYPEAGADRFLCYGLGYYLPPALVLRACGGSGLDPALFVWTGLGLSLAFSGLAACFPRRKIAGVLLCFFGAGWGVAWYLIKAGRISVPGGGGFPPLELSNHLLDLGLYTANLDSFTRFHYQPQHAIPACLGAALLYELWFRRRRLAEALMVWVGCIFWSPITALVLAVFFPAGWLAGSRSFALRPLGPLLASGGFFSLMCAYFPAHLPLAEKGWIWEWAGGRPWLVWYLVFSLIFVIIPAGAVFLLERRSSYLGSIKPLVLAMSVVLLAAPLYRFGYFGDGRMQGAGPAFWVLALAMAKGLLEVPWRGARFAWPVLLLVFLAGAVFPVGRMVLNLRAKDKPDYSLQAMRGRNLHHLTDLRMSGFDVVAQYLGNGQSLPARWLLRPPQTGGNHGIPARRGDEFPP